MKYSNLTHTICNLIQFFDSNSNKYILCEILTNRANRVDCVICVENKMIILFRINLECIDDIYSVFEYVSSYTIDPILQSHCDMMDKENLLLFYNGLSVWSNSNNQSILDSDKKILCNKINMNINLCCEYANQVGDLELCSDICDDIKNHL